MIDSAKWLAIQLGEPVPNWSVETFGKPEPTMPEADRRTLVATLFSDPDLCETVKGLLA